jgi:hypothetical protein
LVSQDLGPDGLAYVWNLDVRRCRPEDPDDAPLQASELWFDRSPTDHRRIDTGCETGTPTLFYFGPFQTAHHLVVYARHPPDNPKPSEIRQYDLNGEVPVSVQAAPLRTIAVAPTSTATYVSTLVPGVRVDGSEVREYTPEP